MPPHWLKASITRVPDGWEVSQETVEQVPGEVVRRVVVRATLREACELVRAWARTR